MKEFTVNKYITLKLEANIPKDNLIGSFIEYIAKNFLKIENKTTVIYVNGIRFDQCKFLLLDVPKNQFDSMENVDNIDEAAEKLDHSLEINFKVNNDEFSPETEFWAHCSNIQAWAENNYDTRLLHRNLAFPLLKKLTEAGDPIAKNVFKDEIAKRLSTGYNSVITYLINEGYLDYLNREELKVVFEELEKKSVEYVIYNDNKIALTKHNELDLRYSNIRTINDIKNLEKIQNLKRLNLSHNKISKIENIDKLIDLKFLNLSFNRIEEIKGLENLTQLEELFLHVNYIKEIKGLETLINLDKLTLWLNPIKFNELYLLFLSGKDVVKFCQNKKKK
ncbi:MAG TPA: leucine-rich repeat protein [Candidatus Lokiarchaeia archaeon]